MSERINDKIEEKAIKQLKQLEKQGKNMRLAAEEWNKEWKTLISIILSARTRDETTIKICTELFKKYNTIEKLSNASIKDIENTIKPVNFYRNKSKSIINCAKALQENQKIDVPPRLRSRGLNGTRFLDARESPRSKERGFQDSRHHKGNVPHNIEDLIKLPGVGRKTANVFLSEYGKDAIGIDTHASYISQKLEWTKNKAPEKIEKDLENLFPQVYWRKINPILVRFGKTHTSRKKKDEILEEIRKIK